MEIFIITDLKYKRMHKRNLDFHVKKTIKKMD